MLPSLASKTLRLLQYPRFQTGTALAGPHEVGAVATAQQPWLHCVCN